MVELDLFKDFTPGEIRYLVSLGRGTYTRTPEIRVSISQSVKDRWKEGRYGIERNKKLSQAALSYCANLTEVEKKERSRKLSVQWRKVWALKTPEELKVINERKSKARINYFKNMSIDEKLKFSDKISEVQKKLWADLSSEEFKAKMEGSLWSDVAIKNRVEARKIRPSNPEFFLGLWLEATYPNEWRYNGDFSQVVSIGGHIPDFINIDGRKAVIEVLGGLGYYHFFEDEEEKITHYKKYGFDCLVVWEWDCYIPTVLEEKFKEWYK